MDTLPSELVLQIFSNLPPSSLTAIRLVSRAFSDLAFQLTFSHLTNWLDYEISHRAIISLAHDVHNRPAVMWSPWASEPDRDVDPVFTALVWKLLVDVAVPSECSISRGLKDQSDGVKCAVPVIIDYDSHKRMDDAQEIGAEITGKGNARLTARNFAELSGMMEMTENRLKTGQNRYLLHRTYVGEARDEKRWGVF